MVFRFEDGDAVDVDLIDYHWPQGADLMNEPAWHGAVLTASLLTALAAVFVFLAARGFVPPVPAVLVALAFGLGSCAWPVSGQALWQHPASTFLLSPRRMAAAQRNPPAR